MLQSRLTDEELMQRLQQGERQCFEIIYDRYRQRLYNYLLNHTRDSEKAEDLLHDTFIKVIEAPEKFNAQFRFSTWVYTIATNLCRNDIRNSERRRQILQKNYAAEIVSAGTQPTSIDKLNFKKELDELVEDMTEENKNIFFLRFNEELTVPEISKILDCPEGTVKSRLFYMLKKMALKLKAYNPSV